MRPHLLIPSACILITSILLSACSTDERSPDDRAFEELTGRFLESYLTTHPEHATELGDHRFDDRMDDYSREGMEAEVAFCRAYLDTLAGIKVETLSPQHMIDYEILRHQLDARVYALEELREWEWNPLVYNPGGAIYALIAREFAPLQERMRSVASRLRAIPAVLEAARKNLATPPSIHTETAILQNDGTVALLEQTLEPFIGECDAAMQEDLREARASAVAALQAHGAWMKTELLPRSTGDFRLGAERYARKFALRLDTDMEPSELLAMAEADLEHTTEDMRKLAAKLHPTLFPDAPVPEDPSELIRVVLDRLAEDRPSDSTIVDQARADLEEVRRFVAEKGLVTLPTEPIEIIVMPEFQRGVAVAYCDAPGALEKNGKTFYAIAPTPTDWTTARRESFYREYNNYMLKNLTVHEAIPGHYLQLAAANRSEAPTLLRAVMPSGVFAEGWATYTEQMMYTAGYGGPELGMQVMKMRLRLLINTIIDQRIHALGMTEREAMDLMQHRGFQEEGEAAGKWRRACLTSAQLSTYYYGNIKVNELRRRAEKRDAEKFSLKAFHDELLSFGTIAPKFHPMIMKLPTDGLPVAGGPAASAGGSASETIGARRQTARR
ncbi:MAG: DUF885 domain-containing protein [Bacteroidetes bacterium]|nr:DUF885 domain-containing protein [Bacteroidota bacterium]